MVWNCFLMMSYMKVLLIQVKILKMYFHTFNEVMGALVPEFIENELNDPENSNVIKEII